MSDARTLFAPPSPQRRALPPLTANDRASLTRLVQHGKLIKRADGYGTKSETILSPETARDFKKRGLAVSGWHQDMYATPRGRQIASESIADA